MYYYLLFNMGIIPIYQAADRGNEPSIKSMYGVTIPTIED